MGETVTAYRILVWKIMFSIEEKRLIQRQYHLVNVDVTG